MNARRKITEEAEKKAEEEKTGGEPDGVRDSSAGDDVDDRDGQGENEEEEDNSERKQLTQRMPKDLVSDVDAVADHLGMTRNAAINMFCRQKTQEMLEQLGIEDDE